MFVGRNHHHEPVHHHLHHEPVRHQYHHTKPVQHRDSVHHHSHVPVHLPEPLHHHHSHLPLHYHHEPAGHQEIWDPYGSYGQYCDNSTEYGHSQLVRLTGFTRIDQIETPEAHVFRAELPAGMSKNDVRVEIEEGHVLCLSGEKMVDREEKGENWRRVERTGGKFSRRFSLPQDTKPGRTVASFEHGVLTVTVPKDLDAGYGHLGWPSVQRIQIH